MDLWLPTLPSETTLSNTLKLKLFIAILVVLNLVGLAGLSVEKVKPLFLATVPVHLLITVVALLAFQQRNLKWILAATMVILLGYAVEVAGVRTGILFGNYHYGQSLGPMILDVPLIMGLNWLMLVLSASSIATRLQIMPLFQNLIAASLMTALDVIMEPSAPKLDFWYWQNNIIPIRNSIGWFLVSFLLVGILRLGGLTRKNPMAVPVFLLQVLFFTVLLATS